MNCALPRLYPILDTPSLARRGGLNWTVAARAMLAGGAQILQLRHKEQWTRAAFAQAEQIAEECWLAGVPLIINDRSDVARMLGAGVHLGQDDLSPAEVRTVVGEKQTIGFSTHNDAQLKAAMNEPVDYVAFGPIFPTGSKQNPDAVAGLELLAQARSESTKLLVAIGGITRDTARAVLAAGADSVALIADLLPDTLSETAIRNRMEEWQRLIRN